MNTLKKIKNLKLDFENAFRELLLKERAVNKMISDFNFGNFDGNMELNPKYRCSWQVVT